MTEKLSALGEDLMYAVHGLLVEGTKNFPALFRNSNHDILEVSFFKIDQRLIEQKTSLIMGNVSKYKNALKEYFDLHDLTELSPKQQIKLASIDKQKTIQSIYKDLKELLLSKNYEIVAKDLFVLKNTYSTYGLQEFRLIMSLLELSITNKWDLRGLFQKIQSLQGNQRIHKELTKLYCQALWSTLKGDTSIQKIINRKIKFNHLFTLKEMKAMEIDIADILNTHRSLVKSKYHDFGNLIQSHPTLIRQVLLEAKNSTQRLKGPGTRVIEIKGFNNIKFPI